MQPDETLGIIAGSGSYPGLVARAARRAGVKQIVAAAFSNETDSGLTSDVETIEWLRVGQLGRLLSFFQENGVRRAVMAGQIAPKNLFDLRPDWKALLLLARLPRRNAETIFAAIGQELAQIGVELLPAFSFIEDHLAPRGPIAGRALSTREESDVAYGFEIAREISRLDIGQTVVIKNGTVLAVEAFEGTNETIKRGGVLARKGGVMVKISKPNQDMRFDVPVIGAETARIASEAKLRVIAVEAERTLILEKEKLREVAERAGISIVGR